MVIYLCLIIALVSTLLWFNIMYADLINALNPRYSVENIENEIELEEKKTKLKITLSIIMGLFWATVIYYM